MPVELQHSIFVSQPGKLIIQFLQYLLVQFQIDHTTLVIDGACGIILNEHILLSAGHQDP